MKVCSGCHVGPIEFSPKWEQLQAVTEDLVQFVHRVATEKDASPAEIAALPEVAKVLYTIYTVI